MVVSGSDKYGFSSVARHAFLARRHQPPNSNTVASHIPFGSTSQRGCCESVCRRALITECVSAVFSNPIARATMRSDSGAENEK